jgi:hypothetical protein
VVLTRPPEPTNGAPPEQQVQITEFPREMLGKTTLPRYVAEHGHYVAQRRFSGVAWSLEPAEVDDLMTKIQRSGIPLRDFIGASPNWGILTGFNQAFYIDTPTKERLVHEDPACADIIKPCLRGRDVKRWIPDREELWIILLKSSANHRWPWSGVKEGAEQIFQNSLPSIYNHMKSFETRLRKRNDQGQHWWELRSCSYYHLFDEPKITYQEIQFHSWFALDKQGCVTNNKVFLLPTADLFLLTVLNSPLMWWHNWRYLPHMKDEALSPSAVLMEKLPIAPPTDATRAEVEPAVERLIAITKTTQEARRDTLDWLHTEFGIEKPGQKLEDFASLSTDEFIAEVRKRRPKGAGTLKPSELKALREGYQEQAAPVQQLRVEAQQLERRLAELVNAAYGLTPAEVELLWRTAPPRMPVGRG